MGADLFGSFAESTCAALVISSNTLFAASIAGQYSNSVVLSHLMFPLVMVAAGIIVCLIVSTVAIYCSSVDIPSKIESTLKWQLILSTALLIPAIYLCSVYCYPSFFILSDFSRTTVLTPIKPFICAILGLVSGMLIGGFTEYMTSHTYRPVR